MMMDCCRWIIGSGAAIGALDEGLLYMKEVKEHSSSWRMFSLLYFVSSAVRNIRHSYHSKHSQCRRVTNAISLSMARTREEVKSTNLRISIANMKGHQVKFETSLSEGEKRKREKRKKCLVWRQK